MNRPFPRSRVGLLAVVLVGAGSASLPLQDGGVPPAAALESVAPVVAPPPPPPPPVHWSKTALRDLADTIEASSEEGLDPDAYDRDALTALAAADRTDEAGDAQAMSIARGLARDYALGRVRRGAREAPPESTSPTAIAALDADLAKAVEEDRVRAYLKTLLPTDRRYGMLRDALPKAHDPRRRAGIRASMERWRWMPRTLGPDYLLVNIPAYTLTLYREGEPVATHAVVVGAPKTPTPELVATATSVVVNPWWTLPPSVLAERGRYPASRGFVTQTIGGKTRIRQRPGPNNALGRIKIDMPNDHAIYLHDTPARWAFGKPQRALSHGCIRVQGIERLAAEIAGTDKVRKALSTQTTRTVTLETGVPVYLAYFTVEANRKGDLVTHPDPYDRDSELAASLDAHHSKTRIASR